MSAVRLFAALPGLLLLWGCLAPQAPVRRLGDTVIDGPVTWDGEVRIAGVVTVKKEGALTIRPGTVVRFERFDRDGDGIGDGELLIEGELDARGEAQAPILFTSAEARPQPADWKYLYLDYARRAEVAHIVSEYAYSGIQVHFCKARIFDSEFRHNVDGVRFSTVNIEVAGNRIHNNRHGIRYEERRGGGTVHHNDIVDNDIGVFVVTRAENRTLFTANNISSNRSYNVKLGLDQAGDVTFPRNWWGSVDPAAIAATFYDHSADPALGEVLAGEPLAEKVDPGRRSARQGDPQ